MCSGSTQDYWVAVTSTICVTGLRRPCLGTPRTSSQRTSWQRSLKTWGEEYFLDVFGSSMKELLKLKLKHNMKLFRKTSPILVLCQIHLEMFCNFEEFFHVNHKILLLLYISASVKAQLPELFLIWLSWNVIFWELLVRYLKVKKLNNETTYFHPGLVAHSVV